MHTKAARFLVLTLLALPVLLNAQVRKTVKVDVPFEFIANRQLMPAGPCTIVVGGDGIPNLLISSGTRNVLVVPHSSQAAKLFTQSVLVFHRYGNHYFLSSIRRQGEDRGYELPPSRQERELQARALSPEDVELVAEVRPGSTEF